ncbi:uncharacterized protein LOC121193954 isoform X2 [Toxotes jaculatrix]|nr:uncharacterized protein LOC121193954 isoform X2 [Toxotes jaculatrix]XP_040912325.1 uncharacterized protein LOC121193954 isoform X2 [Toxotes jaculatrix]
MTAGSVNIFILIIFTVYLSFIFHTSYGFEVIQPELQTMNQDGSAFISCEHTANVSSVEDVRLYTISPKTLLCQKGMDRCENVVMYSESPERYLFIMLNISSEAMDMAYQCEFTLKEDRLLSTKTGKPTRLQKSQKETGQDCTSLSPPPPFSPVPEGLNLFIILTGLLAVMILYSCVITCAYIRRRMNDDSKDPENSTYVEMRKAPSNSC